MSQHQIDQLKNFLVSELGLTEEEFFVAGNGMGVTISVELQQDFEELPEELKPFECSPHEVERAMSKGSTTKQTWNGANFELALRDYAHSALVKDPEYKALQEALSSLKDLAEFREYEAKRQAVWKRVTSQPHIAAWDKQLEDNYL